MSRTMTKEHDFFRAIKSEDLPTISRILAKYKTPKHKLLGHTKRNIVNMQDCDGMSGLHQAALMCQTSIMQILLDNGANVDIKDNQGMRPLHYSSWQGKLEPVTLLLQYSSSVNEPANNGGSPLHLACQYGHVEITCCLLCHGASLTLRNDEHKTPLDLACEYGRHKVVEALIETDCCQSLLEESPEDRVDNSRTTCLHLAARNGHPDVIRLLLGAGIDINRSTLRGTALHEAAAHGKMDCAKLLIECGADVIKPNSFEQTALDIVCSDSTCHDSREMKQLLKENASAVEARAIKDFFDPTDVQCLPLKEGDNVTVLQQCSDGRWKGTIFQKNHTSQTGYFPATAVQLLDRPVGGMQRTGTLKANAIKKVAPPVVPELNSRHSGSSFSSGYGSTLASDRISCCSVSTDDSFPLPPRSPNKEPEDYGSLPSYISSSAVPSPSRHSGLLRFPDSQTHYTQVIVHPRPSSHPSTPTEETRPISFGNAPITTYNKPLHGTQSSLEDQGIDIEQSPGRESPGASSGGSRNSTSSLDSGRASTSGSDGKVGPHRMSVQSYESSRRQSYHSSNSSLGSVDRIDDSAISVPKVNVTEMIMHSVPDTEILQAWLTSLNFEDYTLLFTQAGYDMPTVSRMTPEDLTAIGVKKPTHRRRLKAEIDRLNITDGIPEYKPNTLLEWLQLLRLEEYYRTLCYEGYDTVDRVTELAWEDLEEIGIQKLGHQKKIMLAIKRVKDINTGTYRSNYRRGLQPHSMDAGSGDVATLPQPTSLGHAVQPVLHCHYPSQEVAITTSRAPPSPTGESSSIPELKTFQQPPQRNDGYFHLETRYQLASPSQLKSLCQQNVTAQMRSTNRGHSLERLDVTDSVAHCVQSDMWYDTDGELGVHGGESCSLYCSEGTSTLHRPKGMVKPRPVAKIIAKTRQEEVEASEIKSYIDKDPEFVLKSIDRDGWSSLEGSPRHILPGRTSQLYGTLKVKRIPPPPPIRTNSVRCETQGDEDLDLMQDKAFATCVQSLRSRFDQATNKQNELLPLPSTHQDQLSPTLSEGFPPPPSPLPSVLEDSRKEIVTIGLSKTLGSCLASSAKDSIQFDEPSANLIFRQRRKNSADSNSSTSSTDSNSFPFANDNAGTIKQKVNKIESSNSALQAKYTPVTQSNKTSPDLSPSSNTHDTGSNKCGTSSRSGDVIHDIESMLANLSNQLDAMLETEASG
ncbi:caskin-2-like isoform X2 [Tachypleus tridentatus]|uniref:caskin-2-like isoform X2 n=1 Tax=Tachypleus tridentatus TaxID=6853 RepID=UPI003FCF6ADD